MFGVVNYFKSKGISTFLGRQFASLKVVLELILFSFCFSIFLKNYKERKL